MKLFSMYLFGQRLRQCRATARLTQEALAARLGVSQGWLSELETACQRTVQADTVVRLCWALECSADYLLGLSDDPRRAAVPAGGAP